MKTKLQCPFCFQTSALPQGIAAHIRFNHPEKFENWKQRPHEVKFGGVPDETLEAAQTMVETDVKKNPQALIQAARESLLARIQAIDEEMARLEGLGVERKLTLAELAAVEKALTAFPAEKLIAMTAKGANE